MKKLVIIMFCILLAKNTNAQCDWEWIDYVDFEYIADSVALIDGDTAYIINDETFVISGDTINVCDIDLEDYDEDSKGIKLNNYWHKLDCDSQESLLYIHNQPDLYFNPIYAQDGNNTFKPIDKVSYNYYKDDNLFGKEAKLGCGPRAITVACYFF